MVGLLVTMIKGMIKNVEMKWVVTIELRTHESNELKGDPVRSDWSGSEIGGAVMK